MQKLWKRYPKLRDQLNQFEDYLLDVLKVRQPLIKEAVLSLAEAGGKRIRPALVLAAGQFKGKSIEKLYPVAAAVEIMHMATLIHDDIVDEAEMRRGVKTTQSRYGKDIAVFTGDYLFSQSFILLSGEVDERLLKKIARSVKYICEGEIDQYDNRYNLDISYLKYFRRIRRKTAILFQASCSSAGYQIKLRKKYQIALNKFGHYLGMIFQITDDILDVASSQQKTGKPVGNDFSQGIYTLPIIFALEDDEIGNKLRKLLEDRSEDKDKIIELINSTDALARTQAVLNWYADKARTEVDKLPSSSSRDFMKDLLEYVMSRNY